jgi:hypothetical protein
MYTQEIAVSSSYLGPDHLANLHRSKANTSTGCMDQDRLTMLEISLWL